MISKCFKIIKALSYNMFVVKNIFCSEEWLKRMDSNLTSIRPIFEATYGKDSATKWIAYWRTFFISVAEIFGFNNGDEWMVALFLLKKK
ncbi:unnamed protein product [Musa textilis]